MFTQQAYRIPKFQTPRLNFAADMTVKVFNSAAERAESMALSVGVAVTAGPVDLDLKMSMDNSQSSETKTVISEANVGVSLYDLGAFKFSPKDLHPELLSEFNKLPTNWADNPMMFNDFVARWGTQYVAFCCVILLTSIAWEFQSFVLQLRQVRLDWWFFRHDRHDHHGQINVQQPHCRRCIVSAVFCCQSQGRRVVRAIQEGGTVQVPVTI
jgi:hypothetical protein